MTVGTKLAVCFIVYAVVGMSVGALIEYTVKLVVNQWKKRRG